MKNEYIKDNEVFINEYEQRPIAKESEISEEVFSAHSMHLENTQDEQKRLENDFKGKKTAGRIWKAGKTKTGRIWICYQDIDTDGFVLINVSASKFLALLDGINGIYCDIVRDANGFPIGKDIILNNEQLTERLRDNRILFLDGQPLKITA